MNKYPTSTRTTYAQEAVYKTCCGHNGLNQRECSQAEERVKVYTPLPREFLGRHLHVAVLSSCQLRESRTLVRLSPALDHGYLIAHQHYKHHDPITTIVPPHPVALHPSTITSRVFAVYRKSTSHRGRLSSQHTSHGELASLPRASLCCFPRLSASQRYPHTAISSPVP
jgi:hypothetical protein